MVHGHRNDGRTITVRNLLCQTSGLPDYVAQLPTARTESGFRAHPLDTVTAAQAVALAMKQPRAFAPGKKWQYSNTNYALAGMIIGRVTGHSWQQEAQKRIVTPLGLRHTYTPYTNPFVPGPHAIGYERFPKPGSTPQNVTCGPALDATWQNPSWGGSAGAIISTTEDSNRFLRALVGGRLLRPAQLAAMEKTVPTDKEFRAEWPGSRYGLGLMWIPNSCGGSWSHGGDIQGYMTRNGVSPDGRRSVVVTMNTDSPVPQHGVRAPKHEMTRTLIDHALCPASG